MELWCVLVRGALLPHTADSPEHAWSDTLREPVWLQACLREVTATYGSLQTLGVAADALDEVNQLVFDLRLVMCQREVPGEGRELVVVLVSGLAFLPAKTIFCHLPVLTGLNRQKVAENGKNENDTLAHFTCFLKPVNTSIRNT